YCLTNPPYELGWIDKEIPISKGSPITRSKRFQETYKNVSQEICDQLNAEAEVVQIILTGIDNDIYSTVDACPNACKMWKAIERLKQDESINVQDLETNLYWEFRKFTSQDVNIQFLLQLQPEWQRFVTLVKQNQELKTVSYHKLYDILKQHQYEVNEIRAEKIARVANPLALVSQQQPDKEIDKLMDLISLSFKKIYKPTNNNLRTSSNTSRANQDNSPKINKSVGYENQRIGNFIGARETVGSTTVQKSGIQCYNCKEFGHVAREYQELEAYYMYMAQLQEVSPDVADSGPIFDDEPLQKVPNDDHYNVFAMKSEHPEQSISVHDTYPIEQDAQNVIIDSLVMSYDREEIDQNNDDNDLANERELLASLIEKLKGEIEDFKTKNKSLESSNNHFKEANNKLSETNSLLYANYKKSEAELTRRNSKEYASQMEIECEKKEAQIKLYKTREDKELEKVIALENKVKVLDNIVYKTGQSVQTMNMLNNKCRTSFTKPEFLKKAQRANPRLYDIDCYNDNLALMLAPESDEDLKAQLQDKGIVISELKKLIEKLKGKSVDTKFENSSVIRQLNAFKSQRPLVLGKPTTFSNSKPVTAQTLPPNKKSILKNMNLVEIVLCIVDSRCSKHMTGNLKLLINFLEKFMGTVKFENDQIAPILGYGDLVQGAVTIKRVYYVEGLNHMLFSVGQFCYADLEVAFRKSTCYIRNLKGNDLLTCSRGTDLYSITLQDINSPNPICLMARATSSQAWLWHRRLSHLNFNSINLLSKNDIVVGLPKLKLIKDHLC
nr:integrase, catalytic region, zinc finger, CCHC-type, peptidase aspartic, catalytic [Tanacetum cinerariifolium]